MKSLRLGWVAAMWIPAVVACAQASDLRSKWGEIAIHQHVAGAPWFGMDARFGRNMPGAQWVAGMHHQGWAAWQQHSVSGGQHKVVGGLSLDVLVQVGVDRWPQLRQADAWASAEARFSHVVEGSGTFAAEVGWTARGAFQGPWTWSASWQPPNPAGLLGCPELMWSQEGQWGVRWNPDPTWMDDLRLWRRWSSGFQVLLGGPRWVAEVGWSWSPALVTGSLPEETTKSLTRLGRVNPRRHGWRVVRGQRGVVAFHHLAWRWEE